MSNCRKKAPFPLLDEIARIKCHLTKAYLVFVNIGEWYELFGEDAHVAAPILGTPITHRDGVPMCGVPFSAIDSALAKVIRVGKFAALVERHEDGRLSISRIITPGTPVGVDGNGK